MKLAIILVALLAAPAFADHYRPRYGYGSSYRYLPRREVTTITRDGNRTRVETRRYYSGYKGGRVATPRGAWSGAFRAGR